MNLFPGCNTTICPRFGSSSGCTGRMLICAGGKVIHLWVCCLLVVVVLSLSSRSDFGVAQLTGNGTIPPIVGQLTALTRLYVVVQFGAFLGCRSLRMSVLHNIFAIRSLYNNFNNRLSGTIPTTIGQLTMLGLLCVTTLSCSPAANEFVHNACGSCLVICVVIN